MARGIISMLEGSGLSLDVTMEFLTDIEGLKDVYVIPNASFATVTGDDSVNHIISMSSSPKFNSIDTMPLILSECNDILLVESSSNEFEVSFEVLDMSSEI